MSGLLSSSGRRARNGWGVRAVALSIGVSSVLGACTSAPDAGPSEGDSGGRTPSPEASWPAGATQSTASAGAASAKDTAAVTDLLRRRAAAVVGGDEQAYAAGVADPTQPAGRRQLGSFAAARALRVSRLDVGDPVVELLVPGRSPSATPTFASGMPSATGSSAGAVTAPRVRATVDLSYRVDDLDRGDRVARVEYDLVQSADGWQVVSERPVGAGATAPWVAMPTLRTRRGEHAVVAGTAPPERLAEYARIVDRALPALRATWSRTPARVLVLAPSTAAEADVLLGRPPRSGAAPVAATTEGPTGPGGTASGDRVVLDPTAFDLLTPSGRDVVVTHELGHVAVRSSVPGRPAAWLAEGYADHLGYARADVPAGRLLAPLVSAVRGGRLPRDLPSASDLQPASGDIEVPYLAAWQAVELIAREHGEAALRRLVEVGSSTGSDADAEAATDAALLSELGTTRAELTRQWLARLRQLATTEH